MTGLADLVFLRPLWWLALPAVLALAVLRMRRGAGPGDWQASVEPHLMAAMAALGRVDPGTRRGAGGLAFAAAGAICLALTGPAVPREGAATFRNLEGVVLAIDVSGSMTRDAAWPAVVRMARAALSALGTRPAALIVYAGDSYLAAPLTTDHLQLGQTVSLLDAETVPDRGNRPALALAQAQEVLDRAGILDGEVILFTDGEGLGPEALRAAQGLAATGARLSVVRAETTVAGTPQPGAAIASLAAVGGGAVYGTDQVAEFRRSLDGRRGARLERQDLRLLFLSDLGRYLLVLALLPVALMFRREGP